MQSAPVVPSPQGKKGAQRVRETLEKALLNVLICLPAPATGSGEALPADRASSKLTPIGLMTLDGDEKAMAHHRHAGMGVFLLRAYQGQGYGSEAIRWALERGFKQANLHRIHLVV
ncbi:hypothetical protein LTR82_015807 [Friedmanniomyces endolithicus]|uniref:N-acetyltransferase domain-containing protein n=1 Tax=Friedmanniomyces endolithicus TaxID=329885 RepID=A0AAN6J1C7_9PEZI|nr:hypothetical protein LTR82_015807 [Friedmanniomyces endolithicus]